MVACLRITDQRPDVDPLTGAIERDPRLAEPSPSDAAALEHALRLGSAWSGRVLAVAAGPAGAEDALRGAAALGAQVLRVPWPAGSGDAHGPAEPFGSAADYVSDLADDERLLARALARAILAVDRPAVVVCGDRSTDRGTGALPAYLAHELRAAQALGLVSLRPETDGPGRLRGERRLDGGRREVLRIPSPAVCSVEAAGVRLRRAPLAAALGAVAAPVPAPQPDTEIRGAPGAGVRHDGGRPYRPRARVVPPPAGGTPRDRLLELTGAFTSHDPPTLLGPLDPAEAADALLDYLRRQGYLEDGGPAGTQALPG